LKAGGSHVGTCALCLQHGPLCRSHALPHAHFRDIHRRNNGVATVISSDMGKLHKSSESGKAFLLCRGCEGKLNRAFDAPCINHLKVARQAALKGKPGTTISAPSATLARFMLSVVWRAGLSRAAIYTDLEFTKCSADALRATITEPFASPFTLASFAVFDLFDSQRVFTRSSLTDFVVPPFFLGGSRRVDFVADGFLFTVNFTKLSFSERKRTHLFKPNATIVRAPALDVRTHAGFVEMLESGLRKYRQGHITF
jgi:hypothetical protein